VLVVAAGYKPKWLWNLWGRDLEDQFQLEPLPTASAQAALEQIQEILEERKLTSEAYRLWSLGPQHRLESRLDSDERKMVARFLSEGIASLQVSAN
jgi:hypothetical protein